MRNRLPADLSEYRNISRSISDYTEKGECQAIKQLLIPFYRFDALSLHNEEDERDRNIGQMFKKQKLNDFKKEKRPIN